MDLPHKVPGIDISQGLALFGGDLDFYLDILDSFLENNLALAEQILATCKAKDMETLKYQVHKLKGSTAIIAANDTMTLAGEIEDELNGGSINESKIICLVENLNLVLDSIKVISKQRNKSRY